MRAKLSLDDSIWALIKELDGVRRSKGINQRNLASAAGISLGTLRAWRQELSVPGASRLVATGLVLGLRLEVMPMEEAGKPRGFRQPPSPELWWLTGETAEPFAGPDKSGYLVNLAIAEIHWRTVAKRTPRSDLYGGSRSRIWEGHKQGRSPTARTLLELAEPVGLTLDWVPEKKSWRPRPWQQKWKGEHPLTGSWKQKPLILPLPKIHQGSPSPRKSKVHHYEQLKFFE